MLIPRDFYAKEVRRLRIIMYKSPGRKLTQIRYDETPSKVRILMKGGKPCQEIQDIKRRFSRMKKEKE